MRKILITESFDPALAEGLRAMGFDAVDAPGITPDEILNEIGNYEGIVVATRITVSKEIIDQATQLKFIARAGSGMENIEVAYATSKNITCISSPEGNSNAVGEHAMALLLSFYHHIPQSFAEVSHGQWLVEKNRTHELEGRTIGLIGYGNTGKSFARKLAGFNMNVITYDKYLQNYSDAYATEAVMEKVFSACEIVSLHVPLTHETRCMVNDDWLRNFSHQIFLINTSRGQVVKHADLLKYINADKVKGAALDVFENENLESLTTQQQQVFQGLINSGKVIFTPHIAGKSFESKRKIAEVLLKKIRNTL
jgi:D-3-phosphoglycerate dehydrogenase